MTNTNQTLDQRAFKALLLEKFPSINKNCIESFMENRKLFTMTDFLNRYGVLNSDTIKELHYDFRCWIENPIEQSSTPKLMEFIMSEV